MAKMLDRRAAAAVLAVCCVGLLAVRSGGGVVEMLAVAPQAKGAAKAVNALLGVESTLKTTSLALAAADSRARAVVAATEQSLVEEKEATTKSGYVTGRVHSVADADRQNVNARLVGKLDERGRREAARIKQAVKASDDAMAAEIADETSAKDDRKRAAELRLKAKNALAQETTERTTLSNAEEPIIKTSQELKVAGHSYDTDALALASLLDKVGGMNAKGEAIPAKLTKELKGKEEKMKAEKRIRDRLAKSISGETDRATAPLPAESGLDLQSQAYTDSTTASKLSAKARNEDRYALEAREQVREDNMAAKHRIRTAHCIAALARQYHFAEDKVMDVPAAYATGVAKCTA
eukprot:CAMPEP_0180203320 /NCGR_PEP_ID=MMETSP0987-20121128/7789_1 /TAXON_ID=697907 /ORGANISM="non described non described, Strain CCMP2293" /LENGTH=350 /DNA_ID=CAMNT_0022158683 /DNA_START=16 /DNA_END=1068 /DNA_ORIENTATION=-